MSKSKSKSKNPAYPDAHPTAPGGMSEKALVAELVDKHGWDKAEAKALKWPEKIDHVVAARRQRELEAEAGATSSTPSLLICDPDTYDYTFSGHAGAGPSASERWMNCTGSLALSRAFLETLTPNQQAEFAKSNVAARQGTTAHTAAETKARVLLGDLTQGEADATLTELTIEPPDGEAYDDEMAEAITEYLDLVKQYVDDGHEVWIEQRVSAAVPLPGGDVHVIKGSADFIGLPTKDDPRLAVGDLKYGNGIDVEVTENSQARIYGLGALAEMADDDGNLPASLTGIVYYIVQPRLGGIKEWTESVHDLLRWRDDVLAPALEKALAGPEGGADLVPDEATCQWCPARGACPALAQATVDKAADLFDAVIDAEVKGEAVIAGSLDNDTLGRLLEQAESLVKLKDDLKAEAQRRLHRGESVPGYHLVNYSPPRAWKESAGEALSNIEALWERKMVTPTKALTRVKNDKEATKIVEAHVDVPDKRPVVASVNDRRSKWEGRAPESMFTKEEA